MQGKQHQDDPAHGFLLVAVDPPRVSGGFGFAWNLVEARLKQLRWPIYGRTRNRRRLKPAKHLAFYVGGTRKRGGEVGAVAVINRVESWSVGRGAIDPECYMIDFADQVLYLRGVEYLDRPYGSRTGSAR